MSLLTRTILVTGASSGIGRAVAKQLIKLGHHVVGISRDCAQFQRRLPNFTGEEIDLSDLLHLPQAIRVLQNKHPKLDGAILCAGMGRFSSLEEFSYEQIQQLININFTSQVYLTRAMLPNLKRKDRADLIFIGSEAALKGSRKGTIYCASKFALRGFTQALREECAKSQVRVSLINPGMVNTPFFADLSFAPGDDVSNAITPEDVAEAVLYVLSTRPGIIVDEINLNPANKVIQFKK
jgi:NADP-dependent 3-hydroxy acid dehydrogenase YdfG